MMKKSYQFRRFVFFAIIFLFFCSTGHAFTMNKPDSAYLFAYALEEDEGRTGLHFAWSMDNDNWHAIGPEHGFVKSDYGRWGSQKRMITPFLFQTEEGIWHCVWNLNNEDDAFAHTSSTDLLYWGRQSYPATETGGNCMNPHITFDKAKHTYSVYWTDNSNGETHFFCTTTDFKSFSPTSKVSLSNPENIRQEIELYGRTQSGTFHHVKWELIEGLIERQKLEAYKSHVYSEKTIDDPKRFVNLKPVDAKITVETEKGKNISDLLIGVFYEDINYGADGGLYAELIQNRDFEYALSDKECRDPEWNNRKAWSIAGNTMRFTIDSANPIHENNKHYAILEASGQQSGLINEGFDGIPVKSGDKYDFSLFARNMKGNGGKVKVQLTGENGEIYGETVIKISSGKWKKIHAVITAQATATNAKLELSPQFEGTIALDMISLFPQKTFKGRKNGLRADLAQVIADIKPRFVRFPGGCVAHGDGIHNIYRWKNTIGALEERKPMRNLWGYHQTLGLGYFEYFQYCEDIGAEPLPVLAAGVPCQNSGDGGAGQQCGIPLDQMGEYIQDILDLIEWANGDSKTTKWGKVRAEAGHPKPFNLKYIGIGNEDLITDIFEERFTMIFDAIKEKHPEITVIGTVGPFYEGTDYTEGWKLADKLNIPIVDEHYYNPPGWFIHNQDFYDKYDRSKSKVYLGEYASHLPGRPNNLETALSEALFMTSLERNGDIVCMTSYAPLLAKEGRTQWNPDLIYFNNTEVKPTPGYYVQKLYGEYAGEVYFPQSVHLSNNNDAVRKRVAVSVVGNPQKTEMIVKLVNMLPVSVKPSIVWKGVELTGKETANVAIMSGKPDDKGIKPLVSQSTAKEALNEEFPPYSFKVVQVFF